jgi:nucleotide-binding universal stress UspA family protein
MAKPFSHILVPTDFGESSIRALSVAVDLAQKYGTKLTLLHAYEVPAATYPTLVGTVDFLTPIRQAAEAQLDQALTELRKRLPEASGTLSYGRSWHEILTAVESIHADLVVMGTHGRQGVTRALIGSVAEKVVRSCPVPVLTVH